jgi:hypothetical protein
MRSFCIVVLHVAVMLSIMPLFTSNNETYLRLHVNCPIFLSDFDQISIFSTDFDKRLQNKISLKSVQWERMRTADGWTDRTKLIDAFLILCANAPEISWVLSCLVVRKILGALLSLQWLLTL